MQRRGVFEDEYFGTIWRSLDPLIIKLTKIFGNIVYCDRIIIPHRKFASVVFLPSALA